MRTRAAARRGGTAYPPRPTWPSPGPMPGSRPPADRNSHSWRCCRSATPCAVPVTDTPGKCSAMRARCWTTCWRVGAGMPKTRPSTTCCLPSEARPMSYDAGLLQRALDALDQLAAGPVRHRPVFGMRGLMFGDRMFAAIGSESMIVKLRPRELPEALARPGATAFTPGGSPLGNWVEVTDEAVADDPELRDWLAAGLRALRASD
ncbi:MAG: TfoX/Sxy family protein [Gemmatimonadetes bacterium]|nr:TfoX/Sxy family protein [Gemmatimonadota bacterium]